MRHEDDGGRVVGEVLLEPVARFEVEVVGGLVEQQQAGAPQQQLGERDAHLPAAGERLGRAVEVVVDEAEPAQHGGHAQIDGVAVRAPERLLELRVPDEHPLVFALRHRRVAEAVLEVVEFLLLVEQAGKGRARLVTQRAPGVHQAVLRQVADGEALRLHDRPGVRFVEPRQHPQQRGLSRAVGAAKADAVAQAELPRDGVEQDAAAEGLGQLGELDHRERAGRGPRGQLARYHAGGPCLPPRARRRPRLARSPPAARRPAPAPPEARRERPTRHGIV